MKKIILSIAFAFLSSMCVFAQDNWSMVATGGLNYSSNHYLNSLHVFNGQLYVAGGSNMGYINRTTSGNPGSWAQVCYGDSIAMFKGLTSTSAGGGKMFAIAKGGMVHPSIYQTTDGTNWSLFYRSLSYNDVDRIFPFKGLGAEDSIYAVLNVWPSNVVVRAAYNTLDTTGYNGSWDTVLDFNAVASNTRINCVQEHNGKMFLGTNLSTLWSSADGVNWTQNNNVGNGFGNSNNYQITSLTSFGGYLYVGTDNGTDGAQLWRSNDETTWTLVQQFPQTLNAINGLFNEDGKLWVALKSNNFSYGFDLYKSVDGTTFTVSATNGFGDFENNGNDAFMKAFGNNVYWTGENYFGGRSQKNRSAANPGSQIWRLCNTTPPTMSLGADLLVCAGTNSTLDAGPASEYLWNTGDTTQTITVHYAGLYYVNIVGANGCSAGDSININHLVAPTVYINYPSAAATVCKDSVLNMSGSANSNLMIPFAPITHTTTFPVMDYAYENDTIPVSGIIDSAGVALYSVTIDSLYHTYTGDVSIRLYAPNGSSILLFNAYGGASDNLIGTEFTMQAASYANSAAGPFTGAWQPAEPFYWLYGNSNGNWRLELYDAASGDTGVFKGWSIRFAEKDTIITYSWTPAIGLSTPSSSSTQLTAVTTTNYTLTATNSIGCSSSTTTYIEVPSLNLSVSNDSLCYGDSALISVTSQNPVWYPYTTLSDSIGSFVIAHPLSNTTYFVQDTVFGCFVRDSALIAVSPAFSITSSAPTICATDYALAWVAPNGGVAPYNYIWNDATNTYSNDSIYVSPTATTSYTIAATDAFGCNAYDVTSIGVTPSTDILGNVTYSGGPLANGGTAVLYKYYPFFISFDTVQTTTIDASGNYLFAAAPFGEYIVKVFPNASYPTAMPTYFSNTYLWDNAGQIIHGCAQTDTANIVMVEQIPPATGPGLLAGRIVEGNGFLRLEGDPIPGIDVKLGRNPGGALVTNTTTDNNGVYTFANLPLNDGGANGVSYTVYVDIPGLGRDSSYTVSIDATTPELDSLNYLVDSTTIYIVPTSSTGISNLDVAKENKFNVYPNPFNGSATIAYTLNSEAEVRLEIYNVLGVKVESKVNTHQQAGDFKYSLNDDMSSGVYFVSLTVNNKTTTQRVVKMK